MRTRDLPLATTLREHFAARGITELYPPQAAAVEAGVCEGENVVAAIPTASGKTFVAELAMLTADGPGLYIVPLRALAREKYETFSELPDVSVGIATGDYDAAEEDLAEHDVVVATSEKVDSAIRNGAEWVGDLACVVVDEVHLLGAEGRGPTLEVTLATLQRRAPDVQVVALSATVDNPEEVADWLGATLVESTWRPVDLRTGVYADDRVHFDDGTTVAVDVSAGDLPPNADRDTEATAALVESVVGAGGEPEASPDDGPEVTPDGGAFGEADGATLDESEDESTDGSTGRAGQCLAFVRSRREAESLAERLAREEFGAADDVARELEALDGTETGARLAECVRNGVAFHHAGLRNEHRAAVERAFRDRELAVICATPTLAAGVNVPARRVVVRDQQRYTGSGMEWLPVLEIHQMCGRAGRPHLDPYGEAVLVGDDRSRDELTERYVRADAEAIESKLADPAALRTHVLSVVATGFADSRTGVLDVLGATFYAHQTQSADLSDIVDTVVTELAEMGLVETGATRGPDGTSTADGSHDDLRATELGAQVSKQYVTPETGARIVEGLRTAAAMESATELTVLEIICDTPDMQDTYLGNRERAEMYQFAARHAAEFTTGMGEAEDFEGWLEAVKTARILHEWSEGATVEDVVERYRIGPGDLDSRVERAEWLLGASDALAGTIDVDLPAIGRVRGRI